MAKSNGKGKSGKSDADPYEPLFKKYVKELKALHAELVKERDKGVRGLMDERGIKKADALEAYDEENGPLVHDPRAIALIRKYWLEVDRLKRQRMENDEEDFLEPLTFLVEDLEDEDEEELVEFLTEIAYWPMGVDENGEWC